MNLKQYLLVCVSLLILSALLFARPVRDETKQWSKAVGGLRARLAISKKPKVNGTSILGVHLQIENVSDIRTPMEIPVKPEKIQFTLLNSAGKPVVQAGLPRSGVGVLWGNLILPHDSSMCLGLTCRNVGIPRNEGALIPLPSHAWVIKKGDTSSYFLQATIHSKREKKPSRHIWLGTITTPTVKVKLKD